MESSDLIALSALFVAVFSFIFSVWQGVKTREHNILMARPILSIEVDVTNKNALMINLYNHGTGVAKITQFEYFYSDEWRSLNTLSDYNEMLLESGLSSGGFSCYLMKFESDYLAPNKETNLVKIENSDSTAISFAENLPKLRITYSCPYNKNYEVYWLPLNP